MDRRHRRTKTRFVLWLLIPALLVWVAPLVVAYTPLRQRLIDTATHDLLDGRVTCSQASLGWLSRVRLHNVQVYDHDGKPLAAVATIASERTLFGLLVNRTSPGEFLIEKPQARIVLRADGSNIEDLIAPLLKKPSSGGSTSVGVTLVDGSIDIEDSVSRRQWRLDKLAGKVQTPSDPTQPLAAQLRGTLTAGDAESGQFEGALSWNAPASKNEGLGRGDVTLQLEKLPLSLATPLLQRFVGDVAVAGELTLDGHYQWTDDGHVVDLKELASPGLYLAATPWVGRDPIETPPLKARGSMQWDARRVDLREVEFQSAFASFSADGGFPMSALDSADRRAAFLSLLQSEEYQLRGEVDLAQLAHFLPHTLRVRAGTEIVSGKVAAELSSRLEGSQRHWDGKVETSNLVADNEGKRITWEQPLQALLSAHASKQGLVLDKLHCQSSFLQAEARGTTEAGGVSLQGDLNQLAHELDRFIDLGDSKLTGQLRAAIGWKQSPDGQLKADGEARLTDFAFAVGKARPWHETELVVSFGAGGVADVNGIRQLDSASIKVVSDQDVFQVELAEAVKDVSANNDWPVRGELAGDLQRWLARLQPVLPLPGWQLAGQADIVFAGLVHPEAIQLSSARAQLTDLQVVSDSVSVREPQVKVEGSVAWDRKRGDIQAKSVTFASSAMAFRADDVLLAMDDGKPTLNATVGFRADLGRLAVWVQDPRVPAEWQVAGMASGQVRLGQNDGVTSARWAIDVDNFAYARAASKAAAARGDVRPAAARAPEMTLVWSEPKVKLSGQGTFDAAKESLQLTTIEVVSDTLKLMAAGTVNEPTRRCMVALKGDIAYDLQGLTQHLRGTLGPMINFEGQDVRPFQVTGPIRQLTIAETTSTGVRPVSAMRASEPRNAAPWPPTDLSGQAGFAWSSANLFGLPLGAGQVEGRLDQGVVDFRPLDLEVSEGRFKLTPRVLLHRPDMLALAEKGQVLDNVRISPEMCSMWLKYVLPIVADVTQVDGKFSAELLDDAAVPLVDPLDGEIQGRVDVHSVQVGPGPMARELVQLVQMIKSIADSKPLPQDSGAAPQQQVWVQLPQQEIPFHWKQRRVYHERLVMSCKDVVMITHGSVGLDHSLDLVAEIPVRDEWLGSNKYLASLKGQNLQVPITGTLTAPRVDRRALQQIATQSITNAASGMLEKEVSRGLDKILKLPGGQSSGGQPPAGNGQQPTGGTRQNSPSLPSFPNFPLPPGIRPQQ